MKDGWPKAFSQPHTSCAGTKRVQLQPACVNDVLFNMTDLFFEDSATFPSAWRRWRSRLPGAALAVASFSDPSGERSAPRMVKVHRMAPAGSFFSLADCAVPGDILVQRSCCLLSPLSRFEADHHKCRRPTVWRVASQYSPLPRMRRNTPWWKGAPVARSYPCRIVVTEVRKREGEGETRQMQASRNSSSSGTRR